MLTIPLGQEGSINRLICKAKKSKNLLCLSLSDEPVIEQEFDWIDNPPFPLFTPFFSGLFGWQKRILSSIEHQTIGHFCLSLQTPLIGQVKLFVQASAKE